MHPNPIYRADPQDRNLTFARQRGFGIASVNGDQGPLLAHIPYIINDAGTAAYGHLMRSNPIWRAIETATPAVIAVSGGDAYISPDWYGVDDQVPTWNYVAVHLRGTLERVAQDDMRQVLDSTAARFEPDLLPKKMWTSDKMTPDVLDRMMRQIVPIRLNITGIDGTWKLSQNKSHDSRIGVVNGLETSPVGQNINHISALMAAALADDTA